MSQLLAPGFQDCLGGTVVKNLPKKKKGGEFLRPFTFLAYQWGKELGKPTKEKNYLYL